MGDSQATATANAAEGALLDYLSQVGNLSDYFAQMTSAARGYGEGSGEPRNGSSAGGDAMPPPLTRANPTRARHEEMPCRTHLYPTDQIRVSHETRATTPVSRSTSRSCAAADAS